jgi:hypothetical protein
MILQKFLEFNKKDLEPIKSFYLKESLNPKLWDDFNLDGEVREDLLKIGKDFFDSVELECEVKDIVFCGSLCNYNWSEKYSDYDLHIIIDFKDVDENLELVEKLCDYAKKKWNLDHDIFLKGFEVEVAIQDEKDFKESIKTNRMGGAFSVMKNKWVKKPEKVEFIPDEEILKKKATAIMDVVDEIESKIEEDKYPIVEKKLDSIWKKIKKSRQSGLEEGGEFSTGNLVFKLLRRNGYVAKVMDMKKYAYDKQFESINEWYDDTLLNFLYELDKLSKRCDEESYEGWSKYLNYEYQEDNKIIIIESGSSGYEEGSSEDWIIDFSDLEEIVVKWENSHFGPYGDGENKGEKKFHSFKELLEEIKENF